MIPTVYLTLQKISPSASVSDLTEALANAFPTPESRAYLDQLTGKDTLPSVVLSRLSALALLPSLCEAAGISTEALRLARDAEGRPYCDGADMDFNLSHSASYVACALLVGGGRVGVDVEDLIDEKRAKSLAHRFCTEGEKALLTTDIADGFTRIWTAREALAKQDGRGMPLRFDASLLPDGVTLRSATLPTGGWLTICHPNKCARLEVLPTSLPLVWN